MDPLLGSALTLLYHLSPMSDNNFNFGVQTACTPEQLEEEIKDLHARCSLEDFGTFYFTYGEELKTEKGWFSVVLKFYDEKTQLLHTAPKSVLSSTKGSTQSVVAIDECTFTFGPYKGGRHVLLLSRDWSDCDYLFTKEGKKRLGSRLLNTSLSKIRTGTSGDFELKSQEGDPISIHTVVLKPLWPFFSAALESNMKEAKKKQMKLSCSTSTLEVIVRHFYQQRLDMSFQNASELVVVAKMYDIPELLNLAIEEIKRRDMTVEEGLTAWTKSKEAGNDDLREYCVSQLKNKMPDLVECKGKIERMTKPDMLLLFMDISSSSGLTSGAKRSRTQ